jgi:hypothetical protein
MNDKLFDELLKKIREEEAPAEQVADAQERVLQRLTGSTSLACAEIRPQLAEYAAGNLKESRRLLIDDHLSRCLECRHALAEVKGKKKVVVMPHMRSFRWTGWMRWAVAAAVVLMAIYLGKGYIDSWMAPSGPNATIVSLSGDLYRLPQESLPVGSTVQKGDVIRTARGGRAILKLNDGSRIELNERTELAIQTAWSGDTIRLNRGDIMVQAAKQRHGSLRVVTHDSVASVKGTIFSVSSGTAGSLVSVVEGSVAVSQAGSDEVLTSGQQAYTSATMKNVTLNDAISWSQDAEKYYSLLNEFARIEKELADMPGPAPRTEAGLLSYIPSGTQGYVAIPNLDNPIQQVMDLIEQYSIENSILQEWWTSGEGQKLREIFEQVQVFTQLLGEEVVFLLVEDPSDSDRKIPLLMAHVLPGREPDMWKALDDVFKNNAEAPYELVDGLLLVSGNESQLESIVPLLGSGASSPFAAEINNYYQKGVTCLVGIDVSALTTKFKQSLPSQIIGLSNMQYLFFELDSDSGGDATKATLSFQGHRSGILSWLASPASAGSIEYISPEAIAVLSASTRNPREAFDELMEIAGQNSEFIDGLEEFESKTGIRVGDDIASSLGTDFTMAVERLSIPIPGCVGIFEVLNPDTLDETVNRLVDAYNEWLPPEKADSMLVYTQEITDGRTWNSLKTKLAPVALYWTYDRGYLITSLDRTLADRAIDIRDSGLQLIHSSKFQEYLPVSAGLHNSGLFWFDNNEMLSELASAIPNPELLQLIDIREPSLVMVNAEDEQIRVASHSRLRLTSLFLSTLLPHVSRK